MSNNSLTKDNSSGGQSLNVPGFIFSSILIHILFIIGLAYLGFKTEFKNPEALSSGNLITADEAEIEVVEVAANQSLNQSPEKNSAQETPQEEPVKEIAKDQFEERAVPVVTITPRSEEVLPPKKQVVPAQIPSQPTAQKIAQQLPKKTSAANFIKVKPAKNLSSERSQAVAIATTNEEETKVEEPRILEEEKSESSRSDFNSESPGAIATEPEVRAETLPPGNPSQAENHPISLRAADLSPGEQIEPEISSNHGESTNLQSDLDNPSIAAQTPAGTLSESTASGPGSYTGKNPAVRELTNLSQMPNNPRPQYSPQERLQGHQGTVVFHAYVNSDGHLSNFKMVQSSGYRNLDKKSLATLKEWRFQPGQDGWVELPFSWALEGTPQPYGRNLRTSQK